MQLAEMVCRAKLRVGAGRDHNEPLYAHLGSFEGCDASGRRECEISLLWGIELSLRRPDS
jgi:hypothetical protein